MRIKRGLINEKLSISLLVLSILFSLSACKEVIKKPGIERFIIEPAFYYSYASKGHLRYVVMPKVTESVPEGYIINEQLAQYNTLEELQESETWRDWPPEDSFRRYYNVSNKDGICSLNIIDQILKENGNPASPEDYCISTVASFYYDENTNKVLTREEYLQKLGTDEEEILQQFNEEYGDRYTNRTYDITHIIFWYDENNELQFSTYYIDQMDSNTADFHLLINGISFKTAVKSPEESPFGDATKREEQYYGDVWAGSWWIKEYYNGAYVLYSLNKESGKTYPFHVEITKVDEEVAFVARTYRGAAIGDTKTRILELYPEIDPHKEKQLYNTDNFLKLEGNGGYLYLEFYFDKDILTKLTAGTLID